MTDCILGTYQIVEKLGEGGMGSVFRAVDLPLHRDVAIKIMRPELAGQAALLKRFHQEAATLAKLNHPNVATVYALLSEGSEHFIVMEYVDGCTLHEYLLLNGAIPWQQAIPWFARAMDGVTHAHAQGIIHRDIKPANFMVSHRGDIKVLDFGIAQVLGAAQLTRTGFAPGTLEYMSPERIANSPTDHRSDIYSLGVVVYQILCGVVPFSGTSEYAVMKAQVEDPPPPLRQYSDEIPEWLQRAVLVALAKNPDDRFASVADFKADLLRGVADLNAAPSAPPRRRAVAAAGQMQIPATRIVTEPSGQRASLVPPTRLVTEPPQAPESPALGMNGPTRQWECYFVWLREHLPSHAATLLENQRWKLAAVGAVAFALTLTMILVAGKLASNNGKTAVAPTPIAGVRVQQTTQPTAAVVPPSPPPVEPVVEHPPVPNPALLSRIPSPGPVAVNPPVSTTPKQLPISTRPQRKPPPPGSTDSIPSGSGSNLSGLPPAPTPATPQRIEIAGSVQQAKLVRQPDPVYPPLAKQTRVQGTVKLSAIVSKDGTIQHLEVISGHPLLVPAALEAGNQWVFTPTLLKGEPVEVVTQIDVNFTLSPPDQDRGGGPVSELKRMRGDLGVMSGLIATNGKELAALKARGERNYFEFILGKAKAFLRVGDIALMLIKTDPKKNKYTVDVMADDKLTEKKDKNINEPVQFYTSKAKQPYELVVNQVQKDWIVGYLSTPTEELAHRPEMEHHTAQQAVLTDLKPTHGNLGVQSGLIATNASELAALRRLGERNYFAVKLGKTKAPQRVGDIALRLIKTDPKKNKYTVDVMADDKLTEKKYKNINEPVQFYTSKAKQPYELVVNEVRKDLIVGYLSTPKEQSSR
ncbi:MAG: TonB family protein [Acidobacteriia bacterium]|nr:TonB family protein [Terriglobia bacterium]